MKRRFRATLFGLTIARRRSLAWVLLAIVMLVDAVSLANIRFDNDIRRGFSSESENSLALAEVAESLAAHIRPIMILVESDKTFVAERLGPVRDFALDVALLDNVEDVSSPFAIRYPPTHPEKAGETVLTVEPETSSDPFEPLERYTGGRMGMRAMVSSNKDALLVSALAARSSSEDDLRTLMLEIDREAAPLRAMGLRVTVTGEDAISFSIVSALKRDVIVLNLVGAAAALVLSLIIFRGWRWAFVAFAPAGLSALFSLALFSVLGLPVTVMNVIVPILVMVLALSDSMHLTATIRGKLAKRPLAIAVVEGVADVAPANALTSITTALAFASISVSGFEQLDELALLGGLAVMAAYWIVIAGVTAFAAFGPRDGSQLAEGRFRVPGFIVNWATRKQSLMLVIAAFVFCLGAIFTLRAEPWFPLYQNLPEHHDVRRAHRIIEDEFGGYFRLWFIVEHDSANDNLERIAAVSDAVEHTAPDYAVISLATIAEWSGSPDMEPDGKLLNRLPPTLLSEIGYDDPGFDRIVVLVPEPMHDRATRERHDRMVAAGLEAGADRVVGFPVILREDALRVVSDLAIGLVVACVLSVGLLAWAFASLRLAPILLAPNLMPILVAVGSLSVLNAGRLNPTAALALTVAFGVALDDTIHFLNRYALETAKGESSDSAIANTITGTGRVMVLTTLLISTGMASTMLSDFSTVRLFGTMTIMILICALIADLLFLPALMRKGFAS